MKAIISGKMIGKFKMSKKDVHDLNNKYEKAKSHLEDYGKRLAGRLDSELNIIPIFEKTSAFQFITKCMETYITQSIKHQLCVPGSYNLNILSCWINDMKSGEYNPPHTHNETLGYSSVLFLKVPKFINDSKFSHKFKDGQLCFINAGGRSCKYLKPKVGDFYLFEADHQHAVMPFKTKNNEIRRSMSFNFILEPPKK